MNEFGNSKLKTLRETLMSTANKRKKKQLMTAEILEMMKTRQQCQGIANIYHLLCNASIKNVGDHGYPQLPSVIIVIFCELHWVLALSSVQ